VILDVVTDAAGDKVLDMDEDIILAADAEVTLAAAEDTVDSVPLTAIEVKLAAPEDITGPAVVVSVTGITVVEETGG